MTFSGAVGLMALFLVDLVDIYFLSLLGEQELAAAVGFAGTLLFFLTSLGIGLSIGMGAKVSQALGAREVEKARRRCTHIAIFSFVLLAVASLLMGLYARELLAGLGAEGRTLDLAERYTLILMPTAPFLGLAIALTAALRACGDARRSMYATLSGGVVNAVLDPILIFGVGWGFDGAAWASFVARMVIFIIAIYQLQSKHGMLVRPRPEKAAEDIRRFMSVSGPACLTSMATPIGNTYVMYSMATFGDSAVAGSAIIGRIVPVAFAVLFALSGAIGPIIGQNLGARLLQRVRQTLKEAVLFTAAYVGTVWVILFLSAEWIVAVFDAQGDARMLLLAYCHWVCLLFFFNGVLFVANATFNNINRAPLATVFNLSRSLLGTLPFVTLLALYLGPLGVVLGDLAGAVVWGSIALVTAFRQLNRLQDAHKGFDAAADNQELACENWPYSSGKTAIAQQLARHNQDSSG